MENESARPEAASASTARRPRAIAAVRSIRVEIGFIGIPYGRWLMGESRRKLQGWTLARVRASWQKADVQPVACQACEVPPFGVSGRVGEPPRNRSASPHA